jgi:6-phosphogluconate dehydrogenase
MGTERYEIGMVGLGVMGRNMLLNMADHGFPVAGYDNDPGKVQALREESKQLDIHGAEQIKDFVKLLRRPRAVMMLVPAGPPVDSVIADLLPHLDKGDLIMDAGNSYFKDTSLRAQRLSANGILFLGVGVSGGEEGARRGPSIMPGGPKETYERVRAVLEAVAAKVNGDPCVAYLGPGAAGHFVKMVHNGIEYAVMQLLAESYDLMKRGLGLTDQELHDVYETWNEGELNGYLVEITGNIFSKLDEKTGTPLIDQILDVAKQKGTGMWTSQSAMEMQVPTPTIDLAVSMRDLSALEGQRELACAVFPRRSPTLSRDRELILNQLRSALNFGMIMAYAQGFAVLAAASEKYEYQLDLEAIARIWRGGCIIRTSLLEDIRTAFKEQPRLQHLLLDAELAKKIMSHESDLRNIVCTAVELGLPIPGLMTALGYFDGYRSAWLPANLIQAQRDYFGAHTYERIDMKGTFHTEWEANKNA